MAETSIEWTDKVWNPTVGCTRISPGCKLCYAFALHDKRHAAKLAGKQLPDQYAKPFTELQLMEGRLTAPLRWRKPCRVFVNSVSDLFHRDVPDDFIDRVFAVMAMAPQHTFQVLTKRADRLPAYFASGQIATDGAFGSDRDVSARYRAVWAAAFLLWQQSSRPLQDFPSWSWPLPNVWLGVSVEDQQRADERIPHLLNTPAAVRFLSCEPLLGPVNLTSVGPLRWDVLHGWKPAHEGWPEGANTDRIDWCIVGGESGQGARPCCVESVRHLVRQCQAAAVPVFVKQLGANVLELHPDPPKNIARMAIEDGPGTQVYRRLKLKDSKGGDMAKFPDDLKVREFPR